MRELANPERRGELLRLEIDPSFQQPRLTVCLVSSKTAGGEDSFLLRCETSDYSPERRSWEIALDPVVAASILADLESLRLSPVPNCAKGADGVFITLVVRRGFNEVSFKWWLEAPEQWKALDPIVEKIIALSGAKDS